MTLCPFSLRTTYLSFIYSSLIVVFVVVVVVVYVYLNILG